MHRVHYQEGRFALANLLVAVKPTAKVCSARFLYYLLTAKKDQLFIPLMKGTANVSLKVNDIASVRVPVPSSAEQEAIVARIDAAATKIEEAKQKRDEVENEANAMLRSAFAQISRGAPHRKMDDVAPLVRRKVKTKMGDEYPELGIRSFGSPRGARAMAAGLRRGDAAPSCQ